ncbi:glutathione S-transferase U17-like [Asparagus officinalis]|uniref:glutathione S-transferase U17-like n=1 Tax=Asparagus officinalis TaxID=4686 RepID=UPI00098E5875|nr:glutathione S-transferase U17-like [Asparagus officinalis]
MAEEEVKILGAWPSPFVMRPRIALNLKGVKYEFLEEVLGEKSELLLKSNPVYKKIPVMIHKGKTVSESMIIVEYIDEAWADGKPAILPADPYDRAVARFWAVYIDDKIFPSMKAILMAQTDEAKTEAGSQASTSLQLLEEAFKTCSKGQGFFSGETIGSLDIALGSCLGWIRATEKMTGVDLLTVEKTPLLAAWAERFCADEAVKEVMPETDRLVEVAKMLQAKWKASA